MSLAGDFIRFHHQPGAVFRHRLATSSESDAFAVLILALLISFLGRIPGVALTSQSSGAALAPSLAATFVGGVLFGALFFYALAALFRCFIRGPDPGLQARNILFWTLVVLAPWGLAVNLLTAYIAIPAIRISFWALLGGAFGLMLIAGSLATRAHHTDTSRNIGAPVGHAAAGCPTTDQPVTARPGAEVGPSQAAGS